MENFHWIYEQKKTNRKRNVNAFMYASSTFNLTWHFHFVCIFTPQPQTSAAFYCVILRRLKLNHSKEDCSSYIPIYEIASKFSSDSNIFEWFISSEIWWNSKTSTLNVWQPIVFCSETNRWLLIDVKVVYIFYIRRFFLLLLVKVQLPHTHNGCYWYVVWLIQEKKSSTFCSSYIISSRMFIIQFLLIEYIHSIILS